MSVFAKVCTGFLLSALCLSVQAAQAEPQSPDQVPAEQTIDVTNATEVIQTLYVSNAAEIKVADLAKQRLEDASIQEFADELTRDHSWMNKVLETMANIKSVSLKSDQLSEVVQALETKKAGELQALAALPQEQFRSTFIEMNIAAHQKTLELYAQIESQSSDDAIKATIAIFRQLVEKHLADAQKLQASVQQPAQPSNG